MMSHGAGAADWGEDESSAISWALLKRILAYARPDQALITLTLGLVFVGPTLSLATPLTIPQIIHTATASRARRLARSASDGSGSSSSSSDTRSSGLEISPSMLRAWMRLNRVVKATCSDTRSSGRTLASRQTSRDVWKRSCPVAY